LNAQVLGISVDHVPCLEAWAESLDGIYYPLLSDFWPHGAVAEKYGVFRDEGYTERAIFIIDKEGIIRYVDIHDIDDQPDNEELFEALREIDPEAAAMEPPKEEAVELPSGGVVMYCSKWCSDCIEARAWLKDRGHEYIEIDVWTMPGAADQVREWAEGKLITPTFDIDGKIILDFDKEQLEETLGDSQNGE
jgi:glutaredoxin